MMKDLSRMGAPGVIRYGLLLVLGMNAGVRAQDTAPELRLTGELPTELRLFESMPMVITAARKPQRITEAPSTIDVFTDEDIRNSGALTLSELLERLPGIYTPRAQNGQDMLWIRGVGGRYNDNALLLIDGVPYRSLYYSHFPINEQVPLEDIKKVEVIRGPGSALYGTGAFAGVVNVITKSAPDIKKNEVSLGVGTWETQNHFALLRKEFDAGGISFFGKYFSSEGYPAQRDDEGFPSDLRREPENLFFRLKLKLYDVGLHASYSRFRMNDFTAASDEEEESGREERDHFSTQLSYQAELRQNLSLQLRGYYNYYDLQRDGEGVDKDFTSSTIHETRNEGNVTGLDALLTAILAPNHTLLMGLDYEYEHLDHVSTRVAREPFEEYELTEWASPNGGDRPVAIDNHNFGVFLEDEYRIGHQWILTGGIRFDTFEASTSHWSPRVSAVYLPDEKTAIKVRYGEAFRAPTYQELYRRSADGEGEGSTSLSPQTIQTAEFEVSRFVADDHRVNATAYYSEFDDFIKVIGDGDFENLKTRTFYGLELGLHGNVHSAFSYFANYSLTQSEEYDGSDIAGVPEHMGNVGLTYTGLKYVDLSPHVRLVGDRNRPPNYQEDVPEENQRELLNGYAILNLTFLSKEVPGPFRASLSIRNLLDEDYHTSGEQTEDFDVRAGGRRVLFSLSASF